MKTINEMGFYASLATMTAGLLTYRAGDITAPQFAAVIAFGVIAGCVFVYNMTKD